ncbi:hypothetical protein M409DRAFT_22091 [Zasmidium cellare ATCC 36951]|uniref:F-box domain-containing protein n=1 Tax=Zasmidium cellare ATCC 36951 TaxID=1080233 RepID=A0A6A6CR38_ZASCE|nr:uncharacterized protein M409DRAFT_22091 [Zasmidium cellare ATCC 36951]KAF2167946.1 hypothetical protein M409DRAFT_22091 [Zasmidium cellare ATCC 36951]
MASEGPSKDPHDKGCVLFTIPVELQLSICELVVIEHQPMLLNCPCNSSYRGRQHELEEIEEAWEGGTMRPPAQPAITQTCRALRELALPIFYKENVFRSCYCRRNRNIDAPIKWLRMIGPENRKLLRHLYFYDRNQGYDRYTPKDLAKLRESEIFSEMGGKLETLSSKYCSAHLVTFGEWTRKEGEVPLANEEGVPRLRAPGEM